VARSITTLDSARAAQLGRISAARRNAREERQGSRKPGVHLIGLRADNCQLSNPVSSVATLASRADVEPLPGRCSIRLAVARPW
jgi:hypothetical protein